MKQFKTNLLNGAAGLCLLAFSVRADDTGMAAAQYGDTNQMRDAHGVMRSYQLNGAVKASAVIGSKVYNLEQEELGKVNDLLIDVQAGRVVQVIVANGGMMGMGSTLLAVPPGILRQDEANHTLQLDVSKEKFLAGPKFVSTNRDELGQSNAVCEVYNYYGERPFFVSTRYGTNVIEETMGGPLPLNMDGTPTIGAGRLMDIVNNQKIAEANGQTTNGMREGTNMAGAWGQGRQIRRAQLGYLQKASKLMGLPVKNLQDEKIGTVKDLAVDLAAGRIVAVVVSTGGFLGMGNELSTVPPTALRSTDQQDALVLDTTKEALASAPHFNADQWPDIGQRNYADKMYRAYGVNPYFNTNSMVDADNAGRNVRDRNGRTLTPMDQGNSQGDIDITTQIRKAIVADQSMSTTAKNVKIITVNGKVTLRGPVNTSQEKNTIAEIANRVAQMDNVDNQLEVRAKTN